MPLGNAAGIFHYPQIPVVGSHRRISLTIVEINRLTQAQLSKALRTTESQAERLRQIYYKESFCLQRRMGTTRMGFEALRGAARAVHARRRRRPAGHKTRRPSPPPLPPARVDSTTAWPSRRSPSRQERRRIGPPGRWPLLSCVSLRSVQRIRAAHRPQPHVCGASSCPKIRPSPPSCATWSGSSRPAALEPSVDEKSQIQARCSNLGQPFDRTQASLSMKKDQAGTGRLIVCRSLTISLRCLLTGVFPRARLWRGTLNVIA
jgi:hypothetical protein